MKCPVCDAQLRAMQKNSVEIDICPDCKGIWLDRGELDKIIEMAANNDVAAATIEPGIRTSRNEQVPRYEDERGRNNGYDNDDHNRPQYDQQGRPLRKKRGSWLGDILGGLGGDD